MMILSGVVAELNMLKLDVAFHVGKLNRITGFGNFLVFFQKFENALG